MRSTLTRSFRSSSELSAGYLVRRDRLAAVDYLMRDSRLNLALLDLVDPKPHSRTRSPVEPIILGAWRGGEIVGVAALRPSLIFDANLSPDALESFLPFLASVDSGLIKSPESVVTPLWEILRRRGRRSLIDRSEIGFELQPSKLRPVATPDGARLRRAGPADLADLVVAARASLRSEGRPDPALSDPQGFEGWVGGRLARARLVEYRGRVAFVSYVDVERDEGWLVQGVYTWKEYRRLGLAAMGMAGLIHEAREAGTSHVQLALVEGNDPALGLYQGLGFQAFAKLRTVLFV